MSWRHRKFAGVHLDCWATISFMLGYFLIQPLAAGYDLWRIQ